MRKSRYLSLAILSMFAIESTFAMDEPSQGRSSFFKNMGLEPYLVRGYSKQRKAKEEYAKGERVLKEINKAKVELIDTVPKLRTEASKFEVEAANLKAEALKREADARKHKEEAERLKTEALKQKSDALQLKQQADQYTNAAYATGAATVVTGLIAVGTGGLSSALGLELYFGARTAQNGAEAIIFSSLSSEAENASKRHITLASEAEDKSRQLASLSFEAKSKSEQLASAAHETLAKSNQYHNKIKDLDIEEKIISSNLRQIDQLISYNEMITNAQGLIFATQTVSITKVFSTCDEEGQASVDTSLAINVADHSLEALRLAVEKAHDELEDARGRVAYARRCANSACHDADEACAARDAIKRASIATNAILNATTDATPSEIATAVIIANADVIAKAKSNANVITSDQKLASLLSEARYAEEFSHEAQARLRAAEEAYEKVNALFSAKNLSEMLAKEARIKINLLSQNDPELKKLNLNAHNIDEAMLIDFCRELEANTFLEELYLDSNKITDLGAQWIFLALENNKSLKKLSLMNNQITSRGAMEMETLLKHNKTLREIYVNRNPIDQYTIDKLQDCFPEIELNSFGFKGKLNHYLSKVKINSFNFKNQLISVDQ